MWTSHVTCERVMSHANESCHIWTSHVTYERVTSPSDCTSELIIQAVNHGMSHHIWNESCRGSCHIWMSHVTYQWDMSHTWMTSRHTWRSHVTYEWVMSPTNESCHTWTSHVTYERVMSQSECGSRLIWSGGQAQLYSWDLHIRFSSFSRWQVVCVFICVCVRVCVHSHTLTHTQLSRPPYPILFLHPMTGGVRFYMRVCSCVCVLTHTHTDSILETFISDSLPSPDDRWCACIYMCVCVCVCTHPHSHTHKNTLDCDTQFCSVYSVTLNFILKRNRVVTHSFVTCLHSGDLSLLRPLFLEISLSESLPSPDDGVDVYMCVCVCVYTPTRILTQ